MDNISKNENLKDNNFLQEKEKIGQKLDLIHKDIKKIIEDSNRQYLADLSKDIKNEHSQILKEYFNKENQKTLKKNMVDDCRYKENCEKEFNEYLENSLEELNSSKENNIVLKKYIDELNLMRKDKTFETCNECYEEVYRRFENQTQLISSLKSYKNNSKESNKELEEININEVVDQILDPVANNQRLKIIKAISIAPQTFSELSKITDLRGGNLLFHIEKLQNSNLIFQKHDRGEYILTKKGFEIINLLKKMQKKLNIKN